MTISSEELVREARRGDRQAFDELVRRFRDAMVVVAQEAIGSREAAEDVVQDAFLQALRALPQLHDPARFGSWLTVITRCRARRVGSRDWRCEPADPDTLDQLLMARGEWATDPADQWQHTREQATLHAAVAQLPPEYQLVLRLYYFEDWSVRRIATRLALSVSTVKWRLHRGRQLLHRQLAHTLEGGAGAEPLVERRGSLWPQAMGARDGRSRRDQSGRERGAPPLEVGGDTPLWFRRSDGVASRVGSGTERRWLKRREPAPSAKASASCRTPEGQWRKGHRLRYGRSAWPKKALTRRSYSPGSFEWQEVWDAPGTIQSCLGPAAAA
jgi:RNA polymerase sigma-70 factor, ECF subfamily